MTEDNYTTAELIFPFMGGGNWTTDATPLLDMWNSSNSATAMWFDLSHINNNTPSIGAALVGPSTGFQPSGFMISSCSIYATWYRAEMYVDYTEDLYIHSPLLRDYDSLDEWASFELGEVANIHLDLD